MRRPSVGCRSGEEIRVLKLLKLLSLLVVAALGAAFAYINPDQVTVSYYFGDLSLPLGMLIFLLLGGGILVGVLVSAAGMLRLQRENIGLRRRTQLANQEINNLRAMPLRDR